MSDHLAGATAGRDRIKAMVTQYGTTSIGPELARIAHQIDGERAFLSDLVHALGLHERNPRQVLGAAAERLGRLKFNRSLLARSPMSPLLELELMRSAVIGKRSGWQVLGTYAADLGLPEELFTDLAQRAAAQARTLEDLHERVRTQALYTQGQHVA